MGKTARAEGVGLMGIDGIIVEVQVGMQEGLPGMDIVGLPSASIREARHRVKAALLHAGVLWPNERLVANFAPADFPKAGTGFDLPLAASLLAFTEQIPMAALEGAVFYGELGLDAQVRAAPGAINAALTARAAGRTRVFVADDSVGEVAAVPGVEPVPVANIPELLGLLRGEQEPRSLPKPPADLTQRATPAVVDLAQVRGQARARRALEIAAAGGHNLLMVGPPGCGKTLLARALPGILPPMSLEESIEVTRIHSAAGLTRAAGGLVERRPFRAPHATASYASLVGGGTVPRPGEASLAHRGVLFLDELPEFRRDALEALRAPLEDGSVRVARSMRTVRFPSQFMLTAAMNPCPCGHRGDPHHACRCSPRQVEAYQSRVSGPLLDRIDLHVELAPVTPREMAEAPVGEASAVVRDRVVVARATQEARNVVRGRGLTNAELGPAELERWASLGSEESLFLVRAARRLGITARAWHRVIKVARTIADLAGSERVERAHLAEALSFRSLPLGGAEGAARPQAWRAVEAP